MRVTVEQAPIDDSDRSTAQTVERMAEHIRNSSGDPALKVIARTILSTAGGRATPEDCARAVFYWIKAHIRFRTDEAHIARLFGRYSDQLELLIEPRVLVRMFFPAGDCDEFTMLTCALLRELGILSQIVTIKGDPPQPDRWSHVYAVSLVDGRPLGMDCSHGARPGWEAPRYFAKRFWNSQTGQPVRDEPGTESLPHGNGHYHASSSGVQGVGLWR